MINHRLCLPQRLAATLCVAVLSIATLATGHARAGGYTHVGGQTVHDAKGRAYYVPECVPECETPPNWNLYWFNCASAVPGPCDGCDWFQPTNTPTWYAGTELVTFMRHADDDIVFARYGADAAAGHVGRAAVTTDDFDTDFSGGVKAFLGRQFGEWYRIEATYLGNMSWEEASHLRNNTPNSQGGTGTLTTAFAGYGAGEVLGLDYNDFVGVSLRSEMNTIELNIRRKVAMPTPHVETSFLFGVRFSEIEEQFGYRSVANVPAASGAVNDLAISTENDLFGAQLGMLAQFMDRSRIWVDCEIKGSVNRNHSSQSTLYTNTDNSNVTTAYASGRDESRTTFTGEVSLAANCNFTRTLTLRAGYNVLWVGGLALAGENVADSVTELQNGPGVLTNDGELFYHGPFVGLTWVR
jgi:hypothetical protein